MSFNIAPKSPERVVKSTVYKAFCLCSFTKDSIGLELTSFLAIVKVDCTEKYVHSCEVRIRSSFVNLDNFHLTAAKISLEQTSTITLLNNFSSSVIDNHELGIRKAEKKLFMLKLLHFRRILILARLHEHIFPGGHCRSVVQDPSPPAVSSHDSSTFARKVQVKSCLLVQGQHGLEFRWS